MNQSILFLLFFSASFLFATSTIAAKKIYVASDPSAKYTVLKFEKRHGKIVHITTKRDGKSGTSFSKREIDCRSHKFRYLGDGDTLKQMRASKPHPSLSSLCCGSISEVISEYACRKAGWR